MKKILLTLVFGILGVGVYGQTIKSLGFNTTNGQVIYSGTNTLTFTNNVKFGSDLTINKQNNTIQYSDTGGKINLEEQRLQVGSRGIIVWGESEVLLDAPLIFFSNSHAVTTRSNLGLGGGITTNRTFVSYDGTNYTTNSVTISNGIITGWTQ